MRHILYGLLFIICAASAVAEEPLFDAKILPSIADKELDFWFFTPPDTGPVIPVVKKVYPNQTFMVLIICRVHPVDSQDQAHILYDLKLKNPDGKTVFDEKNNSYYQGPIQENKLIMASDQVAEMAFDNEDKPGHYKIQMTFHEAISKRKYDTSVEIELVRFQMPELFTSDETLSDWTMNYFRQPDPIRSFAAIQYCVQTDAEWIPDNYMTLAFFRRVFMDNPFLWEYYAESYKKASDADKQKMLLVAAVVPAEKEKAKFLQAVKGEMLEFYKNASQISIPDTNGEITTGVQLDILWAQFLASGTYEPVKKIVNTLSLKKFEGIVEKLKKGEITDMTAQQEKELELAITYQAAQWSLVSNCMQLTRVHKYCRMLYEYDTLEPDVKEELAVILAMVQIKKQDEAQQKTN